MPIQSLANSNKYQVNSILSKNNKITFTSKIESENNQEGKLPAKVKIAAVLATLAGVSVALGSIFKEKKLPLDSFENIKKALYHHEYHEKDIFKIAAGSVGGGLIGGVLSDKKENAKSKIREAIFQMIGNILIPIGFVSLSSHWIEKNKAAMEEIIPKFSKNTKTFKIVNASLKAVPAFAITAASLGTGAVFGNKVGNWIYERFFGVNENRTIKLTDLAPHVDDICLATTLVASDDNPVKKCVQKFVPLALMVAGFQAGIAQEKYDKVKTESTDPSKVV